jgi:hypothetical protein
MHNNDNAPWANGTAVSTGLLLDVDLDTKAVSVRRRIRDSQNTIYSPSQGNYQSLRNGHVLLGHGTIPQLEEYDEHGQVVMRARFGQDGVMMSYRMFRSPDRPAPYLTEHLCLRDEHDRGGSDVGELERSHGGGGVGCVSGG